MYPFDSLYENINWDSSTSSNLSTLVTFYKLSVLRRRLCCFCVEERQLIRERQSTLNEFNERNYTVNYTFLFKEIQMRVKAK